LISSTREFARAGAKQIDARLTPGNGQAVMTCPHAGGSKNRLPDSYNPDSHVLFVSLVEACMDLLVHDVPL